MLHLTDILKKLAKFIGTKNVMEFFFRKVVERNLTIEGFTQLLSDEFDEIVQISFFLKHLQVNISVPFQAF